jgi:hypothetical protein
VCVFNEEKYEQEIREIFSILDSDEDGAISIHEIKSLIYSEVSAEFTFKALDCQQKGVVGLEDLKNYIDTHKKASQILMELKNKVKTYFTKTFLFTPNQFNPNFKISENKFFSVLHVVTNAKPLCV